MHRTSSASQNRAAGEFLRCSAMNAAVAGSSDSHLSVARHSLPQFALPQFALPQLPEPQLPELQLAESQWNEPQMKEPRSPEPQATVPQFRLEQKSRLQFGSPAPAVTNSGIIKSADGMWSEIGNC
jgi:hypothetical protein